MSISLWIQQKGVLVYSKHSMGEKRKWSLISAQINQEPGVEMELLKIIFASNRVAAGEPESEG